jgi:hypothetical protein
MMAKKTKMYKGGIDVGGKKAKYCRMRLAEPSKFDPRSFRVKKIKEGVRLIVGCPKGKYCESCKRFAKCKVGLRAQSLLKAKKAGFCPVFRAERVYKDVY